MGGVRKPVREGERLMAPWEIWTFDFPVEGPHPCVIMSNAARLANPAFEHVNVLLCRTLRVRCSANSSRWKLYWIGLTDWIGKRFVAWMPCILSRNPGCVSGVVSSARSAEG